MLNIRTALHSTYCRRRSDQPISGTKHPEVFLTNHVADIDKTKNNYNQQQQKKTCVIHTILLSLSRPHSDSHSTCLRPHLSFQPQTTLPHTVQTTEARVLSRRVSDDIINRSTYCFVNLHHPVTATATQRNIQTKNTQNYTN